MKLNKKILIVTPIYPPDPGGPATYSYNLKKYLENIKIISFSSNPNIITVSKKIPAIRQLKLLLKIIETPADIIYAQDPLVTGFASVIAGKLTNRKTIIKFVGDQGWEKYQTTKGNLSIENYLKSQAKFTWQYWLQKLILSLTNNVVVPSIYLKTLLNRYCKINSSKIIVIPNFTNSKLSKKIRKQNYILFVGRDKPWKKIGLLKKSHSKVVETMAESKIFVLPSTYEGFPHVLLEAGLNECLIIASNIPAHQEIIEHKKTGLIFNVNDLEDLKSKLIWAIEHSEESKKMVQLFSNKIKSTWTMKDHFKKLKTVL
jgi:glycosyltransferase involved in cell wall biosynthesis